MSEQNLQNLLLQKQVFKVDSVETVNALEELKKANKTRATAVTSILQNKEEGFFEVGKHITQSL